MKRRDTFFASLALGSLPFSAWAQQPGKVWRIGVLSLVIPPERQLPWLARILAESGYELGRNVIIDYKFAQGRKDQLPVLAGQLLAAKPDLLIGLLNDEIKVLKQATTTIPIVMMYVVAPVETGLISSLARPGGNLTGTTASRLESAAKMLQVFKEAVPSMSRLTWLADPDFPGTDQYLKHMDKVGPALGVPVTLMAVRTASDLDAALDAIERERPDGIGAMMTGEVFLQIRRIIAFAAHHKFPAHYASEDPVHLGGLMSYAPHFGAMGFQNGRQIDKILKGAKPGDIPVEEPARFRLVINMKTARAMGLTIPQSVLLRADEVIQ